ncbi:MAG: acyl-CoA dehydrogenase family protein [Marinibacterium sp.]|nr:acyl-CoA dehydrogenase family protein [Marinibacterium sp.]
MSLSYRAPVADYAFLLRHVFAVDDVDDSLAALTAAARFFEQDIAPTNAAGDAAGCRFENGRVRVPDLFHPAYAALCAAGWQSTQDETGLPGVTHLAIKEFLAASNMALGLYVTLTSGARTVIRRTGAGWMQTHVVPRMASGDWCGTMCLTEPHCGTDLRRMTTRAEPRPDGSFAITGTKIFITGGDQDLTDNIMHLVLAKLPDDAGAYHDDISTVALFLVPRWQIDPETGQMGAENAMSTGGIETKMGIRGSATCTLRFDGATGYRLGASRATADSGAASRAANMSGMFDMMNTARLGTGLQAVALTERAVQNAADYARDRLAGQALDPADRGAGGADPIICHPDIRRVLLGMSAFAEGGRALVAWAGRLLQDQEPGVAHGPLVGALLTPVIKAYLSDRGSDALGAAMQVWGGHGFITETGIEQLVRDARILQLYEGANGVQAHDLVTRKLRLGQGAAFASLLAEIRAEARAGARCLGLGPQVAALARAADLLEQAGTGLMAGQGYDLAGAAADFLTMTGHTVLALMWLKSARAALGAQGDLDPALVQRKRILARYWFERELPKTEYLGAVVALTAQGLMDLPAQAV